MPSYPFSRFGDDDRNDDYRDELAAQRKRKHWTRCRDRMCGATDCPTCYPLTFDQGYGSEDEE